MKFFSLDGYITTSSYTLNAFQIGYSMNINEQQTNRDDYIMNFL